MSETTNLPYCFNRDFSCITCCGIFNLNFSDCQRVEWLKKNTQDFLALSLFEKNLLPEYRKRKEREIENHKVREDIYVCPFLGMVDERKAGCLLHPLGSPHKQISCLEHGQNFSFYGKSICQNYFCPSAEKKLLPKSFFTWLEKEKDTLSFLDISRLVAHSFVWRVFWAMGFTSCHEENFFFNYAQKFLKEKNLPITSFETWVLADEQIKNFAPQILHALEQKENYLQDDLKFFC